MLLFASHADTLVLKVVEIGRMQQEKRVFSKVMRLTHIQAVSSWHEYKQNEECGTSVASCLDSARNEQIRLNRHYLQSVAEVILLCSHLEIALRGQDESMIHLT